MQSKPWLVIFLFTQFLNLAANKQSQKFAWQEIDGKTQGTTFRVSYFGPPQHTMESLIRLRLQSIDKTFSNYRKDSMVERFNLDPSTQWHPVSEEMAKLIHKSLDFSRETDGAFDITIGQLMRTWGLGPYRSGAKAKKQVLPSDESIKQALSKSGYRLLEVRLDPPALKKIIPDLLLDLSGIAQGYTVDELGGVLEREGVQSYLVEVGGELRARGANKEGHAWQVAIENPSQNSGLGEVISLKEKSLSTSGNYRDYIEINGRRYSHIFDPRVGRPIPSEFVSASVVTANCVDADALAKAFLILPEKAQQALAHKRQLSVLLQKRLPGTDRFHSTRLGNFEG